MMHHFDERKDLLLTFLNFEKISEKIVLKKVFFVIYLFLFSFFKGSN